MDISDNEGTLLIEKTLWCTAPHWLTQKLSEASCDSRYA